MLLGLIMANAGPSPAPSVAKGDIISFDAFGDGTQQRFRVLSVNGTVAKIIGFEPGFTGKISDGSRHSGTFSNGENYAAYEGSYVDVGLETTYYSSLSASVKNAIIAENYTQFACTAPAAGQVPTEHDFNIQRVTSVQVHSYDKLGEKVVGSRHVRSFDIQDLIEYFEFTPTNNTIPAQTLIELLTDSTTPPSNYYGIISAMQGGSSYDCVITIDSTHGHLNRLRVSYNARFSPLFKIDLSQIQYTKE